jgi:hypothetical protein
MNYIAVVSFIVSGAALSGCATGQLPGNIYKGKYFHNFEASAFTPDGSDQPWCVNAEEMIKAREPGRKSGTAHAVVRGELSPEGKFCNLGGYKHILKVHEVIEVSNVRSAD